MRRPLRKGCQWLLAQTSLLVWVRRIYRSKLLWRQGQGERDGVLLDVRGRSGFRNCNNLAASDGPGQRNGSDRAPVSRSDTRKRFIAQQFGSRAAERRIGHHRYALLLAPRQQVPLDAAVGDAVGELIGRAVIAFRNSEQLFHIANFEIGNAPGLYLPRRA